jgi:Cu(I)/Ag(I) efflux system membrane protein CusA/SilA
MIAQIIRQAIANRLLVLIAAAMLGLAGWQAMVSTPVDAIPDLSDVQVVVRTPHPGQAPQVVEDQVTFPLSTALMAVPGTRAVRGFSFFGDSFVYVLFDDDTDLYWARARVLEYLNQAAGDLPEGVTPQLGPDGTGVGWIFQYALVDRSGERDLADLRRLQDWFLRFELQAVPGVSEVAAFGGMQREYEVVIDPNRLRANGLSLQALASAVREASGEAGGSVLEMAEAEYMIRSRGYLDQPEQLAETVLKVDDSGAPLRLGDVAEVRFGPAPRRGISELDGEGETVGGIIVMRWGENAREVIARVRQRIEELQAGLPEGVEIVTTYDRADLIDRAVDNLQSKLSQELLVVLLVCGAFLLHLRSALVAVISLPLGILLAFLLMRWQGINANIMSLGGLAIAIGTMVDAAVVMVENAHKHLERFRERHQREPNRGEHVRLVGDAATEVGPALFFSLLVITVSFLPVFALQAQEGRLFTPLAWTKTWAMASAAVLAITLIPVLMVSFLRGKLLSEQRNPLSRLLIAGYRPLLGAVLRYPWATVFAAVAVLLASLLPLMGVRGVVDALDRPVAAISSHQGETALGRWGGALADDWQARFADSPRLQRLVSGLGSEFIPELREGDLIYMPSTLPGVSMAKARELLQQSNRLIASLPEVVRVHGKMGRAETATDPAPMTMVETMVQLKPPSEWREGMTLEKLIEELDARVDIPGLTNAWVQPIRNRIDMQTTGVRTPVGIKVAGDSLDGIDRVARQIESLIADVPGTTSAFAERVVSGRYVDIAPDRAALARHGMRVADLNRWVALAIGGRMLSENVEGRERYPVSLRLPRQWRDSPEGLAAIPLLTPAGHEVTLGQLAKVRIESGPPMIRSENARLNGWVFVDVRGVDLGSWMHEARVRLDAALELPPGYSISFSGQYEHLQRARDRLMQLLPLSLALIFLLLYLVFRRVWKTLLVMLSLPLAAVGGVWLVWWLGYPMSVAVAVGFIALAGLAAEFGVIMLLYLDRAMADAGERGALNTRDDLAEAIMEGAVNRVRPKAMTVATILAGLTPVMLGAGTGSEVMQRIVAPMLGGMISAPLLSMLLIPALYYLWHRRRLS